MKNTIAMLLMMMMGLHVFAPAHAQSTPEIDMDRKIQRLDEQVGLSDEQVAKLKAIMESHQPELERVRQQNEEARQAMRTEREAIKREVNAVLTPEQRKLHQADMIEQRIAYMKSELNLTAEQETKVREALTRHMAEMEKLRGKRADGNVNHDAMKAQRQKFQKEMKGILTPEQQKKMKEMYARHKEMHGRKGRK